MNCHIERQKAGEQNSRNIPDNIYTVFYTPDLWTNRKALGTGISLSLYQACSANLPTKFFIKTARVYFITVSSLLPSISITIIIINQIKQS